MRNFGLIGYPLGHSFSRKYFTEKFEKEGVDAQYELYQLAKIEDFDDLIKKNDFSGLNVTIPYKETVMKYLDEVDETAAEIGAVNTILFKKGENKTILKGYNTDVIGFTNSIFPHLKPFHKKALILGTGGAAKAVVYGLNKLGIETTYVSRSPKEGQLSYHNLNENILSDYLIIVNASPVGTFPNVDNCPDIPYNLLTSKHLLYDLVYNPAETLFLKKGKAKGAAIQNGSEMLTGQAIAAWKIWNDF